MANTTVHSHMFEFHSLSHSEQNSRHLATFSESHGYSPVVYPRLFETLTMTFGALTEITLCQQRLRPSPKKKKAKKVRCPRAVSHVS